MKKFIITLVTILSCALANGQATTEGNWMFEVGTSVFAETTLKQGASTGINLLSTEGTTLFSLGAEGGYFIQDNLALKFGFGYSDLDFTNFFTYKFGLKHYAGGTIPLQVDLTGSVNEDIDNGFETVDSPDPLWLGLQMGYAAFVSENIALEPTLRYNASLNNDFTDESIIEFKFNFVIFL